MALSLARQSLSEGGRFDESNTKRTGILVVRSPSILRMAMYRYPPDLSEDATQLVHRQVAARERKVVSGQQHRMGMLLIAG